MHKSETMIFKTAKVYIFLALLSLSIPLALGLSDMVTGLAKPQLFFSSLPGWSLIYLILSAALTGMVLIFLIKKLSATGNSHFILFIRYFILIWAPINNLIYSLLFHKSSSFGAQLDIQIITGMYSAAVGLFFGILMIVGVSAELENLVPEESLIDQKIRGGLTSKLFLSVTVVVAAFLIGAIGVTLMPIVAGFSIVQSLPRIASIAVPFLLLTLLLVYFLSQVMTRPLERSMQTINGLSNKDLTQTLEISSRDELGQLFINLNLFIEALRSIIHDASENAENNTDQSMQLDSLVEQEKELLARINNEMDQINTIISHLNENTSRTVNESQSMNENAGKLRTSVNVQTESVEETSSAAEQMLATVKNIASISQSRKEAAHSLNSVTQNSQENLSGSLQAMDEVMNQLNSLSDINKVINSVSAQTNLLAMNAAIEAAHAGNAGRGFSVVAEEIRKLAESTSENAKNSADFVKGMILSIEQSNKSLDTVNDSFIQVKRFSDDVLMGLEEIASASEEMEQSSNIIVSRMQKLKEHNNSVEKGSLEIQKSIEAVDSASQESRDKAVKAQQEINKILDHVGNLLKMASSIGESSSRLYNAALKQKKQFDQFTLK